MRRLILIVLILTFSDRLIAQPYFDPVGIQYQLSPNRAVTGEDKNPISIHYLQANVNLPVKIVKEDKLLINPIFEMSELDFKNSVSQDVHLYGAVLALTYLKQWKNPNWKTAFVGIARLSSDFKNVNTDHFQPGAAFLVMHKRSEKFTIKFGAFYSAEFFGAFVLPLIGTDWKISKRLVLHGVVPRNLTLEYKITPWLYVGPEWRGITNSYRLVGFENDYFKVEENQVRIFGDFYLTKHVVLNVAVGHTFLREYNKRGEEQRMSGLDSDLEINEGILFKAGIYYRFRLEGYE
jgi:hypothetical protein